MTPNELSELLFEELAVGTTVSKLLDLAKTAVFDDPLMLVNRSFRVLAVSSDGPVDDPVWSEAEHFGGFSQKSIETFRRDTASNILFSEHQSFLYASGLGEKIPRILAPVGDETEPLGYLIILSVKHPLDEEDLRKADILCKALKILLRPALTPEGSTLDLANFTLKQLLDGDPDVRSLASAAATKQFFYVCTISLPDDKKRQQYIPYFQDTLLSANRYNHCFIYKESLFLLENVDTDSEHIRNQTTVQTLLDQYGLTAGYSNPFSELAQLPVYYRQAEDARRVGSQCFPEQHLWHYKNLILQILIEHLPKEQLHAMLCPEYLQLQAYDAAHNTELGCTVITWYQHQLNIAETAAALHVHRNTVTYRLDLIREKVGIPLDRMDVLADLAFSNTVAEYLAF